VADKISDLELEGVKGSGGCLAGQLWRSKLGLENNDIISEWPYKVKSQNLASSWMLDSFVVICTDMADTVQYAFQMIGTLFIEKVGSDQKRLGQRGEHEPDGLSFKA
jgi:hypothetical protein